tara:strand:- start:1300 stop:1530 length:231 start_codon:yes stop_codon:yes gene_type:complete
MKKEVKKKTKNKELKENCCKCKNNTCGGCTYGLGVIGAAIYYISTATSFGAGVIGVLKALVWPAFLIYNVLKFLGM